MFFQDRLLLKIDKREVDTLLSEFGFGPSESFKPLSGWDTLSIVAKTKGKRIVFRFFRPQKEKRDILFLIDVLSCLERENLPVGQVFKTTHGEQVILKRIGKLKVPIIAREYLEGEQKTELSEEELYHAAQVLAKIHLTLRDFKKDHIKKINIQKRVNILNKGLAKKLKAQKDRQLRVLWLSFYEQFKKELKGTKELTLAENLIHGDFHQANLLFKDGKPSAVFDFDHLVLGPRLFDLALFVVNYSIIILQSRKNLVPIRKIISTITDGYASESQLSEIEKRMLDGLVVFLLFEKASWALSQRKKMGDYAGSLYLWSKQLLSSLVDSAVPKEEKISRV